MELRPPAEGNRTRGVDRSLLSMGRGNREGYSLDNEGASPNASEPDSASLRLNGGGQPSRDGEACHQRLSNEPKQPLGRPGWLRRARAERSVEEPGRPGVVEVARCESLATLGREASCDARWPRVTAQYKGIRSLSGSYEESAGLIVLYEDMGQQNPVRWEGALLQLVAFEAVEEVLIA
jgi:hypothetical protein